MATKYRQALETVLHAAVHGTYEELMQLLGPRTAASVSDFVEFELDGEPAELMRLFRLARHPGRPCCAVEEVQIATDAEGRTWAKIVRTARSATVEERLHDLGEYRPVELWIPAEVAGDGVELEFGHPVHAILYLLQ